MSPLSFAVVVISSLAADWVASPDGQLGLAYGVSTASLYAQQHGHRFEAVTHPSAGPEQASKRLEWSRNARIEALFANGSGALACQVDYAFWLEADVWITNLTVPLDDLVAAAAAARGDGGAPEFIFTRDAASNLNTGTGLIRCSDTGLRMLRRLAEIRHSHANDRKLVAWGANGATMVMHRDADFAKGMTLVPAKLMNAYPLPDMAACAPAAAAEAADACKGVLWSPGDFVVHFAGRYPKEPSYRRFLELYPPATWPGFDTVAP